jgi:cytochrome c
MKAFSMLSAATAVALAALTGSALAAGDAASGEKVFAKCKACHKVGDGAKNGIAPELNGLDGRKAASVEGYNYSDALKDSGITWNEASFLEFIKNPKAKVPGTKMVFQGLSSDKEAGDVWAYLAGIGADGKAK